MVIQKNSPTNNKSQESKSRTQKKHETTQDLYMENYENTKKTTKQNNTIF